MTPLQENTGHGFDVGIHIREPTYVPYNKFSRMESFLPDLYQRKNDSPMLIY